MVKVNMPKPPSNKHRFVIIATLLVIFFFWKDETPEVSTLTASHVTMKKSIIETSNANNSNNNNNSNTTLSLPLTPVEEIIQGVNVLFVEPQQANSPCGIVFVAHGCSHSHTDWFSSCQNPSLNCIGLPEEKTIVQIALDFNLVVVAASSENRKSKCWKTNTDGPRIARMLQDFSKRYSGNIPILAFGASSGGAFVSQLPAFDVKINGFISQIMAKKLWPFTVDAAVYITMDRDIQTDEGAQAIVSSNYKAKQIRLSPLPITKSFFSDRISDIPLETSESMVRALHSKGFLDRTDGFLKKDPRRSEWRAVLELFTYSDSLIADQSPISEVMNVAWGMHEMSRDRVKEALQFCLTQAPNIRPECRPS